MIPWSVWSADGVLVLGNKLLRRGWSRQRLVRLVIATFAGLAIAYGLGFLLISPRLDRRGSEAAFYQEVGRQVAASTPLALLYDDWDRDPYPTPFGPIPHDLALQLIT